MHRPKIALVAFCLIVVAVATGPARAEFQPRWVAGDLHLHTPYSHDSWAPEDENTGPEEFYLAGNSVEGHFAVASARGLDYIAITDHNDIRSQSDPGFGAYGVMGIKAYEKSLRGHAQMLGATEIYDEGAGATGVNAMANLLRSRGGVFQINHPGGESVDWPVDSDWRYGYDVVPDTVEVWNITPQWQPPAPSGNDMEGAIEYWEGWLDRGYKVGMTGGSDNHYLSTTAIQGAGQPTTWVYVEQDGPQGVLEGLRAGRTFVSAQPPAHQGPKLFLEADPDGDGVYDAMVGDTVPQGAEWPADINVQVRTENVPKEAEVRTVWGSSDGRRMNVDCNRYGVPFVVEVYSCSVGFEGGWEQFVPTWVRAELVVPNANEHRLTVCDDQVGNRTTYCRNRLGILAMTSPIYIAG